MNLPTPEEALAGMARIGSPRVPMGNDAIPNPVAVPPLRGTLVPKRNVAAGDPTPPTGHRVNEPLGAAYRVHAMTPPMTSPEAGSTTANGMIIPTSVRREDSFGDGIEGSYKGY